MKKKTSPKSSKSLSKNAHPQPMPDPVPEAVRAGDEDTDLEPHERELPVAPPLSSAIIIYTVLFNKNIGVNPEKLYRSELEMAQMYREIPHEDGSIEVRDDWSALEPTPIKTIGKEELYWKPVRIVGRIGDMAKSEPVNVEDGTYVTVATFSIDNGKGESITTLPIPEKSVKVDIHALHDKQKQCMFHGAIVPVFSRRKVGSFRFFLSEIRTEITAADAIEEKPTGEPRAIFQIRRGDALYGIPEDHPYWVISDHKGFRKLMEHIKSELAGNLHINALDHARELDQCIEFIILQALSQGKDVFSAKLHSLVIGPPNVGKGYLTKIALVLNPVGQEVSSSTAKITAAGLIGSVKQRPGRNISLPGVLPRNSGGVVCIQEFHDVEGAKRNEVCGIFTRLMEEGQVIDSTSAQRTLEAETSLHLDQNRYSQIHGDRQAEFNTYSDIAIPMNVLSRFDFIMEIPRDAARQNEVAEAIAIERLGGARDTWQANEWERRLKMLIAFLKSETQVVRFSEDIGEYIAQRVKELLEQGNDLSLYTNVIQDIQLRFLRSVYKITAAIARLDMAHEATREHVDYALGFVRSKLAFITHIKPGDVSEEPSDSPEARKELIVKEYSGREFTPKEVLTFVNSRMGKKVDDRTIRRDLNEIGSKKVKKGRWTLRGSKPQPRSGESGSGGNNGEPTPQGGQPGARRRDFNFKEKTSQSKKKSRPGSNAKK